MKYAVVCRTLACAFLVSAVPAWAEEDIPLGVRDAVEQAWLEGRLELLEGLLGEYATETPQGTGPIALRDTVWRRKAWTRGEEPTAMGELEDPYPVLTALLADRLRRETRGAVGLPDQSPLMQLDARQELPQDQQDLLYYLDWQMRVVYTGRYPNDPDFDAEQKRIQQVAMLLEERNGIWATICLMAFVLIPLGIGWRLRQRA